MYETDDEALRLWQQVAGVAAGAHPATGMADNFWSMGVPGPCGPCSEIYYDRGPEFGDRGRSGRRRGPLPRDLEPGLHAGHARRAATGKGDFPILGPLPKQNIDTGLGVERLAFLLQGVDNVYETDLLRPIIGRMEKLSGLTYGADQAADVRMRVIADHSRSSMMLISDGVTPGNEGRGYVLRRLLRRTVRSARLLGVTGPGDARSHARPSAS